MPLNPPMYKGPDVYYSTNVFVNKVPVALWKPPAGAFNDGAPATSQTPGGIPGYNNGPAGIEKFYKDLNKEQGRFNDDDSAAQSPSSPAAPKGPLERPPTTIPSTNPDPNPSAPAAPPSSGNFELNIDKLPNEFPKNITDPFYDQRISQYFKMAHIQFPPTDWPSPINLSARQIAANFINLCINVLDPIQSQFKFNIPMTKGGVFRPPGYKRNPTDHARGMAADISMGFQQNAGNQAIFKWVLKSNIKYRQIIYEGATTGSSWVHISYNQGLQDPPGGPSVVTMWTPNGNTDHPTYNKCGPRGESGLPPYLQG